MNDDDVWRQIRGTDAEKVLIAAEEAGGVLTHQQAANVVGSEWAGSMATAPLRTLGLTSPDEDYDEFRLSEHGRRLARKFRKSRIDGPERWDAVQRAVLEFIRDKRPGRAVDLVGTDEGTIDDRPLTEDEVLAEFEYLSDHGLAKSVRAWGAPDLRPEITNKGRYAIHEPNIRDYVERGLVSVSNDFSTNTNVHGGNVGAVVGGQGNTASVVQHISDDERSQTRMLVEHVLSALGDDTEDAPLRAKLEQIKADVEGPDPSKPGILAKARDALLLASATEGGRSVIQWIGQIISGLGG
ncbi:hypothetical protein [Terrabacter carboxydivorans]|uniref:Uncharacterized protein n=1 Tax=Terrabacter carboxydivorans TaxID=619730 RepID=A0ABP5Z9A8_9MICO